MLTNYRIAYKTELTYDPAFLRSLPYHYTAYSHVLFINAACVFVFPRISFNTRSFIGDKDRLVTMQNMEFWNWKLTYNTKSCISGTEYTDGMLLKDCIRALKGAAFRGESGTARDPVTRPFRQADISLKVEYYI